MKIAVTYTGTTMDSPVDLRFGRCPYIALVDLETGQLETLANPFLDASGGAGTQAAQWVLDKGAAALLTGHCGPKASTILSDAGVQVVNGISGTVREAVASYQQKEGGSAKPDAEPTPPGRGLGGGLGQGAGRGTGRGGGVGRGPGRGGRGAGRGGGRGPAGYRYTVRYTSD